MTNISLLQELILSYRDYHGDHHHHKERMAYAATALYLAAAAVVTSHADEVLKFRIPTDALITLLIFSAVAGFAFVWWQLRIRSIANDIVVACTKVATELVSRENGIVRDEEVIPTDYLAHSVSFPKILVDALCMRTKDRKLLDSPRISEAITYLLMLVWSIAALIALSRAA